MRHLPPTMNSEEFLEAISPIAEHNDYYFCKADTSLGNFAFCRAYINFVHMEDVYIFKDKFDGYVFVDSKGNEFPAIVEFAPFQRIFRRRVGQNGQPLTSKKRDNKSGTIEQDPDFINFLEELEKMKTEANMPSAEVYLEEIEAREKQIKANHGVLKVSTPLIEFIKNKKLEKIRLREERREERRRKQLEQKRLREEEQNKKMKVLKPTEDKISKESEQKTKDRPEDDKSKGSDKPKVKDNEKKSKSFSKNYEKRSEAKKIDKKQNSSHKSDKSKEVLKEKDSTFVVKVVNNSEDSKKNANPTASETKYEAKSQDLRTTDPKEEPADDQKGKGGQKKGENSESSSKDKSESSMKAETKRIRNKDRPTREIYRPGAKRGPETSQSQSQSQTSGGLKPSSKGETSGTGYKQRVFTRSKP